ncbi:hypothetical protein N9W17_04830 [Jannaschia sp.]|nr:hypothetical protein [Jannaschia sp.]
MPKSKPVSAPAALEAASDDVLASLEAMLDEVTSERAARKRLLAKTAAAPVPPAAAKPAPKARKGAAKPKASPKPDAGEAEGSAPKTAEPRIAALYAKIEKARAGVANRDARIAQLMTERDALRAELDEMRASRSWKITAPLRRLRG